MVISYLGGSAAVVSDVGPSVSLSHAERSVINRAFSRSALISPTCRDPLDEPPASANRL
jgi:hypothetical protein